jgi:hypothetical protein
MEWLAVKNMNELKLAFEHYDADDSGLLNLREFRSALTDLEIELTETQFTKLVVEIDDGSRQIDREEFKACAVRLNLPLGRAGRTRVRMWVSVGLSVLWMAIGTLAFEALEDAWSHFDAFYFSVVTCVPPVPRRIEPIQSIFRACVAPSSVSK